MTEYLLAKHVHVTTVAVTLVLFTLRGIAMLTESPLRHWRLLRIVPHVVDTVLLASALYLAVVIYGYPMIHQGWITGKLIGLVVYIGLGTIALKRGRTHGIRATAFAGALLVFAWILHTAFTRSPWPF